jgi:ribosomal protein S12 methylthiotransferase accessory factor YcaO
MMLSSFFANYFILVRKPVSRVRRLQSLAKLLVLLTLTQGCHNPITIGRQTVPTPHYSREYDEDSSKAFERAALSQMKKDPVPAAKPVEPTPSESNSSMP